MEYWKISDFAKEVGKHQNTVDGWFKELEKQKVHWVNRSEYGEKVYNSLDLKIANYIKDKRKEKWSLDFIFTELQKEFELRPVVDEDSTSVPQTIVRQEFEVQINEIRQFFEQAAAAQAAQVLEMKQQYEEIMQRLPEPRNIQQERQERITEMITRRRIEADLEKEALNIWSTKPEGERLIRVGFFRKEEDRDKREMFVKDYINEHFESRIRDEFELE